VLKESKEVLPSFIMLQLIPPIKPKLMSSKSKQKLLQEENKRDWKKKE